MAGPKYYTNSFFAMNTRCDMVFICDDPEFAERVAGIVRSEIEQVEITISRFLPDSPVSRFNSMKADEQFYPGEVLWAMISDCLHFSKITEGAFDITSYPVIRLWKDLEEGSVPDDSEIHNAFLSSGFDKLVLDEQAKSIRKIVDGVQLDFGAAGKGIAMDLIRDILGKQGIRQAFISFGESSILAAGTHPAGDSWPVGIVNPMDPEEMLHVFKVVDGIVTTSGTVTRDSGGRLRQRKHIIDPRKGTAVSGNSIVSVKSSSGLLGEALSTAWFILSDEEKAEVRKRILDMDIVQFNFNEV